MSIRGDSSSGCCIARTRRGTLSECDAESAHRVDPRRLLPQSGIRAICYVGDEPDYTTRADEDIGGAMVPLHIRNGMTMEGGLVDLAWDFVGRNTVPSAHLDGMRRIDGWEYPEAAVREALANAVVHCAMRAIRRL